MNLNMDNPISTKTYPWNILSIITVFVISFFFIFWVGSYFEVDIFPLENRSTIYTTFHVYIFDKYVDSVIITLLTTLWLCLSLRGKTRIVSAAIYGGLTTAALLTNFSELLEASVLVSIPVISSFFVFHHLSANKIIHIQKNLFSSFFSFAVLCIAVAGLILTILTFSSSSGPPGWIRNHAVEIFLLFSSFSAAFIFFLMVGSIIKLFSLKRIREISNKTTQHKIAHHKIPRKTNLLFLSFFMLLSIFFVLLPHQFFINNEQELVGADTVSYVDWLNNVRIDDLSKILYQAFVVQHSGDIPLSLLLFSPVLTIFPESQYQAIDHLPLILSPLLVLTVFFFTRELTSNDKISLLASFLTAISFQALIGIYAGLYANWLALIFGYISIVFLLRFLKRPTGINYLAFSALLFLMMFSHVYTWSLFTLFIGIFLIISWRLKIFERKKVALIFLIIIASVAFDAGKSIMTEVQSGIEKDVSFASKRASFENLSSIWSNLSQTSLVYVGGLFGNFLILSLCIYWLFRSNLREMPNLFIAIFLSIGILPILFGDEVMQSRVFYNISFQIPAAIALVYLSNQHRGKLLVFAISIWILTISLQTIINFI